MANAGSVNINLRLMTAQFMKDGAAARGAIEGIGKTVSLVKGIVAGFLGVAAVRQVAEFTKATMDQIDATAKLADRLGTSTEALTSMAYAGDLAGVSSEQLTKGLQKMSITIAEAQAGAGKTGEALKAMGLDLDTLRGKAPEEQFEAIADGMGHLATAGQQASAAVAIFGKAGAEMLPMLGQGSAALRDQRKEAEALGLTYSRLDAAKVEQANDAWTRVKATFTGGLNAAAIALSPLLEGLSGKFVALVKDAGGFGQIATAAVGRVAQAVGILGDAWEVIRAGAAAAKVAFGILGEGVIMVGTWIVRAVIGWGQILEQFGTALLETARTGQAGLEVMWGAMKRAGVEAVAFTAAKLQEMLMHFAKTAGFFSDEIAGKMQEAGFEIQRSVAGWSASTQKEWNTLTANAGDQAQKMRDAWSNVGTVNTTTNPIVQQMEQGAQEAHQFASDAAQEYATAFQNVANQTVSGSIRDTFARFNAEAQASAQATADLMLQRRVAMEEANQIAMDGAQVARDFIRSGLNQERLEEMERYETQKQLLDEHYKGIEGKTAEHQLAMQKIKEEHEVRLGQIHMTNAEKQRKFDQQTASQKLAFAGQVFGDLASLMNSHSRKAFEVGKMAAYAQAIVSCAAAIARQYAELPIWAAIPASIAAGAACAIQIQQIASTQFGGGGTISTGGAGTVPTVNGNPVGQAVAPGVTGAERTDIRVQIDGLDDDAMISGRSARRLVDSIMEAIRDGAGGQGVVLA